MENKQPIKQKDLQTPNEFLTLISPTSIGYSEQLKEHDLYKFVCSIMDKYATYREQQAKHAGFIEGAEAMKKKMIRHADNISENPFGVSITGLATTPLPESPYKPSEKGGEDE